RRVAGRRPQGARPALPALARHVRQGRRVRPDRGGWLHQAVGDGGEDGVAGAGPAPLARHEGPAWRSQEAHAIARKKAPAGQKLWGSRFEGGLLPELEQFSSSLETDFDLYRFDIAGSLAHARGLAAAGIISG